MSQTSPKSPYFCSEASRDANEACFGTSVNADVWLLIEYPEAWGKNAVAESLMPPAVKAHLKSLSQRSRRIRVQLIKQGPRTIWPHDIFVGYTRETGPRLFHAKVNSYDDLLGLDADDLLDERISLEHVEVDHPLFLVCTHGVHDKCCAKFGFATYKVMHDVSPAEVWQTSHVGGDRFASNVISFPTGVYYGHVDDQAAVEIMAAESHHEIFLEKYRGRTCYDRYAQVAEYFIRRESGIRGADILRLESVTANDEKGRWTGCFLSADRQMTFTVKFEQRRSATKAFLTCAASEAKSSLEYHLLEYNAKRVSVLKD